MTYFETKKYIKESLLQICKEYADYEAEKIMISVFGKDRKELSLCYREEAPDRSSEIEAIIKRRKSGEPLSYILGKTDFFGLSLNVSNACLTPRADTEVICEKAIEFLKNKKCQDVLDICTGSGCIALAVAANTDSRVDALDISEKAIEIAEKNAKETFLQDKVSFSICDVLSDDFLKITKKYDLIISNPPYIPTKDIENLSEEVKKEPISSLDGGEDGLVFYRRFLETLPNMLKKGGKIIFEIGYDQKEDMENLISKYGYKHEFFYDYSKNIRGVIIDV